MALLQLFTTSSFIHINCMTECNHLTTLLLSTFLHLFLVPSYSLAFLYIAVATSSQLMSSSSCSTPAALLTPSSTTCVPPCSILEKYSLQRYRISFSSPITWPSAAHTLAGSPLFLSDGLTRFQNLLDSFGNHLVATYPTIPNLHSVLVLFLSLHLS